MNSARQALQAEFAAQELTPERFRGEWVVNLASGLNPLTTAAAWGGEYSRSFTHLIDNTYIFRFDVSIATPVMAEALLQAQESMGQLAWFYPLLGRQMTPRLIPNDPQFNNQWHLRNTGQGGGQVGIDANVTSVWDTYLGQGVQIAVIDDGLHWNHPDLAPNIWQNPLEIPGNGIDDDGNGLIDDVRGWDFNGNDNDPTPFGSHGTACAGVAAARGNNGIGVSGAAPLAQLIGLRILEGGFTDADEAKALSYMSQFVDIYSNSWGPSDNGSVLDGPGPLALAAMQNTYTQGRGGLGGLITWAGGNGGNADNSNYDGYANSRFAIGVAAIGNHGLRSSYSEQGANIMVTAPSNGGTLGITTTSGASGYTNSFGGTSSATPLVSGVLALVLEANPNLTARDVQYILAQSSRVVDAADSDWVTNGGGYHHNHKYGFGMIDAQAAVNLALGWTNKGPQVTFNTGTIDVGAAINDFQPITRTFQVTQNVALEHVEVSVNYNHTWRGNVQMKLISPDGTVSLFARRPNDSNDNLVWKFMTVRHWGEMSAGTWTIELEDMASGNQGTWNNFQVNFYGIDPNVAPIAQPDAYSVNEDEVLNVSAALGVLSNDTDPDNTAPLTAHLLTNAANGNVILNPNGSFTYTPNPNFFGTDSFTYRAFDSISFSAPAVVTITVNPVNDAPVAVADGPFFVEGGTTFTLGGAGVLANDSDVDGDVLQAHLFSGPTKGNLVLNAGGSFSYTPFAGTTGADSFQYRAFDGTAFSAPVTVSLTINNRPVAQPNTYSLIWNQPFIVSAPGVLANDSDLDGDLLQAELVTGPTRGMLMFLSTGAFTYTPNNFYYGLDSFTYRVRDPFFTGNTVTVTLQIEPTPVAGDDSYNATGGVLLEVPAPGILWNDVNLGGSPLSAELVSGPGHGELTLNANGSFRYLPVNNFTGVDTFTYRAKTASGIFSNVATVRLNVTQPANRPPVAMNDGPYVTVQGTPLTIPAAGVLANDSDPDGDALTAVLAAGPANGLLGLLANGGFSYTPNAGFVGVDSFSYRAFDGRDHSNVATVTIQVNAGIAPPTANPDAYTTVRDQTLTVGPAGVLGNDTDPQGLPLTAQLVTNVANGVLTLNANGGFVYTPNAGFTGGDSFSYRAFNGTHFSAVTTVGLNVVPPASPPTANPDSFHVQMGQFLAVPSPGVLGNDFDPQGLPLTAQLVTSTAHGILNLQASGGFFYTPNAGFLGQDQFTYRVTNGQMVSVAATVTIVVTPGPGGPLQRVVVAPEAGHEPRVRIFDGSTQGEVFSFLAYEASFTGGVRVATADLTGDGIPDIITAPGAGRAPQVRVFDGATFQPLAGPRGSFLAYASNFTGGVFVAAGDVNGDGTPDIVTGPGAGIAGTVQVFNGKTGVRLSGLQGSFNAYPTSFRGGVRVAAADLNGDGRADVIAAPGPGTISGGMTGMVRTFDLTRRQGSGPFVIQQFTSYGPGFAGGIYVAAGDLDGDGRAEVITASGSGLVGEVKIFAPNSTVPARSFTPLAGYTHGLRVSLGDVNGDGRRDLIVGTGGGTLARARFYDAATLEALFGGATLEPFAGYLGGLNVAGV